MKKEKKEKQPKEKKEKQSKIKEVKEKKEISCFFQFVLFFVSILFLEITFPLLLQHSLSLQTIFNIVFCKIRKSDRHIS